jgi:predicted Rossmann fold flavoprotein
MGKIQKKEERRKRDADTIMNLKVWDVAVVGAGAAGLMTSIFCGKAGLRVLLLDGQKKIGAKILMSGGTRCNITNLEITEKDYASENIRVVRNILRGFTSGEVLSLFRQMGVEVDMEKGGKFFPKTHSAQTVLEALLKEAQRQNVVLETGCKITRIEKDGSFSLKSLNADFFAHHAVLCSGGLSYPTTGSDGTGFALARRFGHSLVPTSAALTPLLTQDSDFKSIMGVALPVCLTLLKDGKKVISFEGDFLFTHFGFSGPAVLNISRHWDRERKKANVLLAANFLPGMNEEEMRQRLLQGPKGGTPRIIRRVLSDFLPENFAAVILKKLDIREDTALNQLKKEDREKLIQFLFRSVLPVTEVYGYRKAEVTAGGISLSEVHPQTLESKLCPGLFFAGEILDTDGRIGGFNFQWAWSSAAAAARAVIGSMKARSS